MFLFAVIDYQLLFVSKPEYFAVDVTIFSLLNVSRQSYAQVQGQRMHSYDMSQASCVYCGTYFRLARGSLTNHELYCKKNPSSKSNNSKKRKNCSPVGE